MGRIETRLTAENIPYEMMPTGKAFDSFMFAYELDFDKYSALVSVGGDGTVHEVVNGMMARKDGKRLPVGMIGNGSGNVTMISLGITDVDVALDYIVAATCIKADIYKCLMDKEEDEGIPQGLEGHDQRRYSLIITFLGDVTKLFDLAIPLKPEHGHKAYELVFVEMLMAGDFQPYKFDVEIDGKT